MHTAANLASIDAERCNLRAMIRQGYQSGQVDGQIRATKRESDSSWQTVSAHCCKSSPSQVLRRAASEHQCESGLVGLMPCSRVHCKWLTFAFSASSSASRVLRRYVSSVIFAVFAAIEALATSRPFFTPSVTVACLESTSVRLLLVCSDTCTFASRSTPKTSWTRLPSGTFLKRAGVGVWCGEGPGVKVEELAEDSYREGVSKEPPGAAKRVGKGSEGCCSVCGVGSAFGTGLSSVCQGSLRLVGREGVAKAAVCVRGRLLGVSASANTWPSCSSKSASTVSRP